MTISSVPWSLPSRLISLLLIVSFSGYTYAQPFITVGPASSFQADKFLIVTSGYLHESTSPEWKQTLQTFSLDLSTPWSVSKPAYKLLANSPIFLSEGANVLIDNSTWVVFSVLNGVSYQYSIGQDRWSSPSSARYLYQGENRRYIKAVKDPISGFVYIPGGAHDQSMLKLNVQQNSNANILMPASVATDMYATVWSTAFNAVVVHGGNTTTPDIMNLFHPGNNSWTSLPIIGADIPSPRSYHCMVEAHGGTKIVLFGGTRYTGNSGYFDIYIFDVATRTWKRGADSDVGYKRSSAACAMAGDIFITWGGDSRRPNETQTPVPPVLLYNIVTDSWLTQFSPPGDSPGTTPPSTAPNVGAIIGGIVGGLVVILGLVGFILVGRKRARTKSVLRDPQETSSQVDEPLSSRKSDSVRSPELGRPQDLSSHTSRVNGPQGLGP